MASIVLSSAGAALGAGIPVVGPMIGTALGRMAGNVVGDAIDGAIFGRETLHQEGARLSDLSVQVSTYGKMIPLVYGSVRLAGNVIWSRPIKETVTTSTSSSGGGKGGGGGVSTSTTTYSYSVTLAIAICEGAITEVIRVWADAKQLDMSQGVWRLYKGDEAQLPDPFIEGIEGVGKTPAYRGLAYVVIEDLPLEAFGNRIPNFTFEVRRSVRTQEYGGKTAEEMVKSIILIPGSGEFVYDTTIQSHLTGELIDGQFLVSGTREPINDHTTQDKANVLVSLDQLQQTCPNLEWVGVVVNWFGESLDAATCTFKPCVEYALGGDTQPSSWSVAGMTRSTARPMTLVEGSPRYGGTPDDGSLVRLLSELRARGLKTMLIPMPLMDIEGKPWRGYLTGSASAVSSLYSRSWGYRQFILHYAALCVGKVDAFVIGSELVGLTKISSSTGVYPFVDHLISLAGEVRAILGSGVKLTYAADWSEYHHTDGGWYHMDALWASSHIDMIGIDAYFPLSNAPQSVLGYNVDTIRSGWTSGEGYDYYYTDGTRTTTAALSAPYAWKNITWFWNNTHTQPNGSTSAWVPMSKPIWFTEYGFPSVDGATNQPNVFFDPSTAGSALPHFSLGRVDTRAQRTGILATEAQWEGSSMVTNKFLWTWDARPFPYFPDLKTVWADGDAWAMGHWVNGKLGSSSLAAVILALCVKAGMLASQVDVTRITDQIEGVVVTQTSTAQSLLRDLMELYALDAVESGGVVKFLPRSAAVVTSISTAEMVRLEDDTLLQVVQENADSLPRDVRVIYLDKDALYQPGTQIASRGTANVATRDALTLSVPVVMGQAQARAHAELILAQQWQGRTRYRFSVHRGLGALEVGDVVRLEEADVHHTLRLTRIVLDKGLLHCEGVAVDASVYDLVTQTDPSAQAITPTTPKTIIGQTTCVLLDIPALPWDNPSNASLRVAMVGQHSGWNGASLYRSEDGGANYQRLFGTGSPSVMGSAVTALPDFSGGNVFDETATLEVLLEGTGELGSVTEQAVLNGANLLLVGDEIIQFQSAVNLEPHRWQLSRFLRGRLGTQGSAGGHSIGERVVVLDSLLTRITIPDEQIGIPRHYKPVSFGTTLASATAQSFTTQGIALRPYAPVHPHAVRDATSGDVNLSWIRCSRLGGGWRDHVDAPLLETTERYAVELWDASFTTLIRSAEVNSSGFTYTAAHQLSDHGALPSILDVKVYQLSEKVGRGKPCQASLLV